MVFLLIWTFTRFLRAETEMGNIGKIFCFSLLTATVYYGSYGVNGMYPCSVLHESCSEKKPCGMGVCLQGRCICTGDIITASDNQTCLPVVKKVSDPCKEDIQCIQKLGNHSRCFKNICVCKEHAVPLHTDGKCARKSSVSNLTCVINIQCSTVFGVQSICTNSMCTCKPGYHLSKVRESCLKDKGLRESCDGDEECFLRRDKAEQHIRCINNKCDCDKGFTPANANNKCVPSR